MSIETPSRRGAARAIPKGAARARRRSAGFALLDALVGLALVGLLAAGTLTLLHRAVTSDRAVRRLDLARGAALSLEARLGAVSTARLPQYFGAAPGDRKARLDTADGSAPAGWNTLLDGLPGGSARARLEGLGPGGGAAPFGAALALRVTIEVEFPRGSGSRRVRLVRVRT